MIDVIQTIAIIATLVLSCWQWYRTGKTIKSENYFRLISTLNDIRRERILSPDLERALFKSRENWTDAAIRRRVYGIMLANILEYSLCSHESGLIDDKRWEDWIKTWRNILSDENFSGLMSDQSIYTINLGAHELVTNIINELNNPPPKSE